MRELVARAGFVPASDGFKRSSVEVRAFGGCLGAKRRGRTWHAAKSREERRAGLDPRISEWGEARAQGGIPSRIRRVGNRTRETETSQKPEERAPTKSRREEAAEG